MSCTGKTCSVAGTVYAGEGLAAKVIQVVKYQMLYSGYLAVGFIARYTWLNRGWRLG